MLGALRDVEDVDDPDAALTCHPGHDRVVAQDPGPLFGPVAIVAAMGRGGVVGRGHHHRSARVDMGGQRVEDLAQVSLIALGWYSLDNVVDAYQQRNELRTQPFEGGQLELQYVH